MARIKGMGKVLNAIRRQEEQMQEVAKTELKNIGMEILAEARRRVPVDQGVLRASLNIEVTNDGWRVTVYADAPHAPFQEFGTGGHAGAYLGGLPSDVAEYANQFYVSGKGTTTPTPFLFPPFLAVREQIVARVEEVLKAKAREFNLQK